jgi:hypothetical protein
MNVRKNVHQNKNEGPKRSACERENMATRSSLFPCTQRHRHRGGGENATLLTKRRSRIREYK